MRQAVEAAREAWGLATMCGVAGKGEVLEVVPRFLITGRRVTGSSFGGVKGRTQVPQLVDRWLAGEIDVESLHLPPHHARRGQPRLRADGGPGRHPQRDRVHVIVGTSGSTIALGIIITLVSVVSIVVVLVAFVWAARKDGEEDKATQKRLGIKRKTRIGL